MTSDALFSSGERESFQAYPVACPLTATVLLAEPVMPLSVLPYINEHNVNNRLPITSGDERKVGYYAGIIVREASTVLQRSRLSNSIGRKPVLLGGISVLVIATILFGLSRTFWALAADWRSRTRLIVARGISLNSFAWAVGATVGCITPCAGGLLSRPHDRWPELFCNSFWVQYPDFLPCTVTRPSIRVALPTSEMPISRSLPPLRSLLNKPVLLTISNYAVVAFLEISNDSLVPLFAIFSPVVKFLGLRGAFVVFASGLVPAFFLFPINGTRAQYAGTDVVLWALVFFHLLILVGIDMTYVAPSRSTAVSVQRSVGVAINNTTSGYGVFYAPTLCTFVAILACTAAPMRYMETPEDSE
ncbi:hypothetical protein BJV78DRAFT_1334855 [Lactifluus subvellereus]|nr:hypothetical protein BJV78DRAFT_1334855 [Lactifluus subvellereus]